MKTLQVERSAEHPFRHQSRVTLPIDKTAQTTYEDLILAADGPIEIFMVWPSYNGPDHPKVVSLNDYRHPTLIGHLKPEVVGCETKALHPYTLGGIISYQAANIIDETRIISMELVPVLKFVSNSNISLGSKVAKYGFIIARTSYPDKS